MPRTPHPPNPYFDVLKLRTSMGMNQDEFADTVAVTKRTVGRWERNGHKIRGYHLRRLRELRQEVEAHVQQVKSA